MGFLSKVHALIAPSAAGVAVKSEGKAYDDARGPMFGSLATMRPPGVSSGGRGNAGNNATPSGRTTTRRSLTCRRRASVVRLTSPGWARSPR